METVWTCWCMRLRVQNLSCCKILSSAAFSTTTLCLQRPEWSSAVPSRNLRFIRILAKQQTPTVPPLTIEEIVAETRKTYSGPLQVGGDLMSFDITDAGVTINPPPRY